MLIFLVINEEIEIFSEEEQKLKIEKLISKGLKTNRSRGSFALKQKICNDIKLLGYDSSIVGSVVSKFDFEVNQDIAKKEYDKLYKRLSRKYSGSELKNKIRQGLYQKGLSYKEE